MSGATMRDERHQPGHFKIWLLKQPYRSADPKTYKPSGEQSVSPAVQHEDADDVMRKRYGGRWRNYSMEDSVKGKNLSAGT